MGWVRVDFHVHTVASRDATICKGQIGYLLRRRVGVVAILDHNTTSMATRAKKVWGNRIIVGEEIDTGEGEVAGLFLREEIPSQLGLEMTIRLIKQQGGVVYVPHPFDSRRPSITVKGFGKFDWSDIDIIEVLNSRSRPHFNEKATIVAERLGKRMAAGSDAHHFFEVGNAFTLLPGIPRSGGELLAMLETARLRGRVRTLWNKALGRILLAVRRYI